MKTTNCRRCSECVGMSHHWTPDPAPDDIGEFACKHCDARGDGCDFCSGDGCPACYGEGVVFVGLSEGGWVEEAATEIVESLSDIEGESMQAGQVAQSPEAADDCAIERVKDIIYRHYMGRKAP